MNPAIEETVNSGAGTGVGTEPAATGASQQ